MTDSNQEIPLESALASRLPPAETAVERRTLRLLARELGTLPSDVAMAALEMSAAIAGVSLRASAEFLRNVPRAARVLDAAEVRAWGEMGRRLAMGETEVGINFFTAGVDELAEVPSSVRLLLFEVCAKQMVLSSSFAVETFKHAPAIARSVEDPIILRAIFSAAVEIARRSAKHSADFLNATPRVAETLNGFGEESNRVAVTALRLIDAFAAKAGGVAADAWASLSEALRQLTADQAVTLIGCAYDFLSQSGSAALHLLTAGGFILRTVPDAFPDWCDLLHQVGTKGNAALVAFIRAAPSVFKSLADEPKGRGKEQTTQLVRRVLAVTGEVARIDIEAALSCFRSSVMALRRANSIEQFEQWARAGMELTENGADARARRSYYALETRRSHDTLATEGEGLALDSISPTLSLYVEALTGHPVEIQALNASTEEARIGDGRTVYLPAVVAEFLNDDLNFRLYKVLAAHAAGQIEFGTHSVDTDELRDAYAKLAELYSPQNVDALDAFSLGGYINNLSDSEAALSPEEEALRAERSRRVLPEGSNYRAVLALFPHKNLATRIFGTLENGRIDRRLRLIYRGLNRDLDLVRDHIREGRPRIAEVPTNQVPFELLFQITLCGGARVDARQFYGQIISELETIIQDYLSGPDASVADTLLATSRVYSLFQTITADESTQPIQNPQSAEDDDVEGEGTTNQSADERANEETAPRRRTDARELFNAWASDSLTGDPDDLEGAEQWLRAETPEQELVAGETAYNYDEWDRELSDHRVSWCRVVEKQVESGSRAFVQQARERYRGTISSIRHQFQMIKPENLKRIANELDGDDYDLNAVIDYVMDRRSTGHQSERLYTKRLRRERDVAVSFLLDQSSSTARTIGRHPLQPYTHPGRRIIDIEKEGLVLMSEALEAVGDLYSINGFTSEGRRNVKFYVVKDFKERYSEEIEKRIGGITYHNNTRLGAAIRHASARLARQEARTRLLIMLSDGRPYDHDYGDARYAREDTREALKQAKLAGITPFCITIDRDSEAELRDLYGEVGYTIIDDVLTLPERMPAIYRRLTS